MVAAPQADVLLIQQTKSCLQSFLAGFFFPLAFSLETGNTIPKAASSFALAHTQVGKCQRYLAKGHRTEMY